MDREEAIKYLTKVLRKWKAFCGTHKRLEMAIKALLPNETTENNKK